MATLSFSRPFIAGVVNGLYAPGEEWEYLRSQNKGRKFYAPWDSSSLYWQQLIDELARDWNPGMKN